MVVPVDALDLVLAEGDPTLATLYVWLCKVADEHGASCYSYARIGEAIGRAGRTVDRLVSRLDSLGVVAVLNRWAAKGKTSNVIVVVGLLSPDTTVETAAAALQARMSVPSHRVAPRPTLRASSGAPLSHSRQVPPAADSDGNTPPMAPTQGSVPAAGVRAERSQGSTENSPKVLRAPRFDEGERWSDWIGSAFKAINDTEPMPGKGLRVGAARVIEYLCDNAYTDTDSVVAVLADALSGCSTAGASKALRDALAPLLPGDSIEQHDLYGRLAAGEPS